MADERGMIIGDRVEARLDKLSADVTDLKVSVGRLETGFEQMDKRVSNLENMQRWALGIMFGSWITLMLALLGLYFKR